MVLCALFARWSPVAVWCFSARGEWVWSYDPDANDEEGGGGEGEEEGMGKMGEREDGEGAEDGEDGEGDAAFTLAVHDQVRFRVRTLEFTQVREHTRVAVH